MTVESSNPQMIGTNMQGEDSCSTAKEASSKFRGVLWLKSGKWGARISFNYKPYWLGTYEMEEEAAMAYDRAAIKLQRSDFPLNFPITVYTVQETKFQSQYWNEEILDMLKDKTYLSKFTCYLANQSLAREHEARILEYQRGISYQMLFQKELTQTDVTHIKGLHIPKEYAMEHLPLLAAANSIGDENGSKSIELTFYDKHYRPWTFRYSYWKSTQTFVFTKGWRHFLKMNGLNPKDLVLFYRCKYDEDVYGRAFYMIDIHRNHPESYAVVRNSEQGIGIRENANDKDSDEMEENETDTDVKLFGVLIGKRRRNHQPFL